MKVAVFGAAGWLGRALLANLAGRHDLCAFDLGPKAWEAWRETDGDWEGGKRIYGDIVDYETVDRTLEGMDAVVHMILYDPGQALVVDDDKPFLIYLKGLWNVLEVARQRGMRRVVHLGSCQTIHPDGKFFSSEVRRPDASLYAVCKRLQEEMCRQFHDAYGLSTIVLRPDNIVDTRLGLGRQREELGKLAIGWVCRHDLAQACRLALETEEVDFDVLHTVGPPEAEKHCNVGRTREILRLEFNGDYDRYR